MKKILIFLFVALLALMSCSKSSEKVLVIYSYHPEYEWCQQEKKGIEDVFKYQNVIIESFYMDTKRKTNKTWEKNITNDALQKIDSFKPDLVIVCDDNACRLVATQFIDKKLPFVFMGINEDPKVYGMPAENITGVIERNLISGTIDLLKKLVPSVESVAIITDNSVTSQAAAARFTQENFPVKLYETYKTNSYDDWKKYVRKIQTEVDALGIYLYFTLEEADSDESVPDAHVLKWTLDNNTLPTFSFENFSVQNGVLCGETQSGYEQGKEAAMMAKEIMGGINPNDLPVRMPKKGTPTINEKTAKKLNIIIPEELKQKAKIIH
jgi:ABC-type uncharacterized transport system substrate-binding protein